MTTMMHSPDGTLLDTPESLMRVRKDAPAGIPIDAIDCAAERAQAILVLLSGQFESEDSCTYSWRVIASILWAVEGMVEEIRILANHGHEQEHRKCLKSRS